MVRYLVLIKCEKLSKIQQAQQVCKPDAASVLSRTPIFLLFFFTFWCNLVTFWAF